MACFGSILDDLRDHGLLREVRQVEPVDGGHVLVDGRRFISFAGNDYLGLRRHPRVIEAACEAMERFGLGAGASRLLAGTTPVHLSLERELAAFAGFERALVFPSGYQANVGVLTSLAGPGDLLLLDRLCHASLFDAARLSRASLRVFPHGDAVRVEALLRKHSEARRRFIVTEGVFSMDGDVAPLGELCEVARRHEAWLVLDDAHALGVLGKTGRGTAEHLGVVLPERTVLTATLSKSLGSQGGFVAAAGEVVDLLVNRARSFIYSTGLAVPAAAGAQAALGLLADVARRERLLDLSRTLRDSLRKEATVVSADVTPIVPVIVGDVKKTLTLAARLFERGIFAPAIRPPTVPEGTARLRISLSSDHDASDLEALVDALFA